MDKTTSNSFTINMAVGGISASISKTVVAPLERVKLLLQVQYSHIDIASDRRYKGIINTLIRIPKEQGFFSLWRGNLTNVARYFPGQALNFAFNDFYKGVFRSVFQNSESFWTSASLSLLAGGCAGASSLSLVYPLDCIRTRLSVDVGNDKNNRAYKGFTDCFVKIMKNEGIVGFYKGYIISIPTYFVYRASYFGLNDVIRQKLKKEKRHIGLFTSFLVAESVSILANYIVYPMDTIRRRMMISQRNSSIIVVKEILQKEGPSGFYRGAAANVLRTMGGALVMVFYEEIQRHFKN